MRSNRSRRSKLILLIIFGIVFAVAGATVVQNKQCVKCHRAKKDAGEKTGPLRCGECQQK